MNYDKLNQKDDLVLECVTGSEVTKICIHRIFVSMYPINFPGNQDCGSDSIKQAEVGIHNLIWRVVQI